MIKPKWKTRIGNIERLGEMECICYVDLRTSNGFLRDLRVKENMMLTWVLVRILNYVFTVLD
jgi:hypothetical protein